MDKEKKTIAERQIELASQSGLSDPNDPRKWYRGDPMSECFDSPLVPPRSAEPFRDDMWFVEKKARDDGRPHVTFGRCRRHAPTMGGYPAVYGTDWCGDHKVDEAKA